MVILERFPYGSMLSAPFADYLNVTTPLDYGDSVQSGLLPVLEMLGPMTEEAPGVFRIFMASKSGLSPSGVVKFKRRGQVVIVSASGGVLSLLRSSDLLGEYLAVLGECPHRVSMLHATADYVCTSPSSAVLSVKAAGMGGDLALTRKRLLPEHVKAFLGMGASGLETGTVYLGNRANADVWGKVYDKQEERLARGLADPGPLVRIEIAVQSDVGATLRDAFDPSSLFFHFAGRSLVEVPPGIPTWSAHGEGYAGKPRVDRSVLDRLDRLLESSLDVGRLVALAREAYGDKSGDVLARLIRKRCLVDSSALEAAI